MNHESRGYYYPYCVETNVIAGKWVMENLEKWCSQSACCKWCQMCLDDNLKFVRFTTIWELDRVSNFEVIEHDTLLTCTEKLQIECAVVCWGVKCKTKVWLNMNGKISWDTWSISKVF